MRRKPGRIEAEEYSGPDDAIGGFVSGRISYDTLVRKLKAMVADGSVPTSLVHEAIGAATEMGRLPVDLSGILMNLFPAEPQAAKAPALADPPAIKPATAAPANFDEPTLPYTLNSNPKTAAGRSNLPSEPTRLNAATEPQSKVTATVAALANDRPAAPVTAVPSIAAASPVLPPVPAPAGFAHAMPPLPVSPQASAAFTSLPPLPQASAPPASLPPFPDSAPMSAGAASGLPPMPPLAASTSMPEASVPAYDDVQAKVDDVVLTALISEFQGLRQSRDGGETSAARPDALDGLLGNYRSARFRSDARRAARGGASDDLKLGKLDDFSARRASIGSILRDRFILDTEVGRGGMGIVYAAVDRRRLEAGSSQPYVALKLLNDDFRSNSDALRVLEAEARKAQALAHPNIATVYDFDRDKSEIFIVMELLAGKPLNRALSASIGESMPGHRIGVILKGICAALSYAHKQGVVHSDLKPGNVFVTDDDSVKLLDFGLAIASAAGSFDVSVLNGLTAAYASPEMFDMEPRDPRDDIFALGCIAYQLLAGAHPFALKASNEAAAAKLEPEPIPDIDPAAWAAIRQSLSFERETRTKSVDEFVAGLFES